MDANLLESLLYIDKFVMDKLNKTFGHKTVTETERENNIRQVFKLVADRYDLIPDQEELKLLIEEAGFLRVSYENLFFGIACIHQGSK